MSMREIHKNTFNVLNLQHTLDATAKCQSKRAKKNRATSKQIEHGIVRTKAKEALKQEIRLI
jgi:hypothetical protein